MTDISAPEQITPAQIDELFHQNRAGDAYLSLALNAWEQGQWQQTIEQILQAQQHGVDKAEVWHLLGCAYGQSGDEQASLNSFQAALQRSPGHINSLLLSAQIYHKHGHIVLAWQSIQKILHQDQTFIPALLLGARCLLTMNEPANAEELLKVLLYFQPDNAEALNLSGNAASAQGQYTQAKLFYERAIQIDANMASAWENCGHENYRAKNFSKAAFDYARAADLEPDRTEIQLLALHASDQMADWAKRDVQLSRLLTALQSDETVQTSFAFITKLDDPILQLKITRNCAQRMLPVAPEPVTLRRIPTRGERLTIGYLSADIYLHATAILIAELLTLHNRKQFVVHLYHYGADDGSALRQRILQSADKALDVSHLNAHETAEQIKRDGVDILIDLKGWTTDHRLDVLGQRPAPLQMHYLGYPGTLGSEAVDYLVSDRFITPPTSDVNFYEALLVLPDCYQVNDRQREQAAIPTRSEYNLPENAFVFADFNQPYKITPQVFDAWLRILRACPDSILWLLDHNTDATNHLRAYAIRHGIAESRLIFSEKQPIPQHVARLALADLVLDTFPVNGHTTTSDTLWAGVPELTIAGHSFISRVAGSLLCNAGLPELVCNTLEAYEQLAISLYRDRKLLSTLRARLEPRENLVLFDTPRWVSGFELGLQAAWARHAIGLLPARIDVSGNHSQEKIRE